MKLSIEKTERNIEFRYSRSSFRSPNNCMKGNLLTTRNWNSRSQSKMASLINKSRMSEKDNPDQLRTLLKDIPSLRSYVQRKGRTMKKSNHLNNERQLSIRSIDIQENSLAQCCEINLKEGNQMKKIFHKASTAQKLWGIINQNNRKVSCWKSIPSNIALDYYLSFNEKDISFLNGQSLSLQPYQLEPQQLVNINSFDILHCIGSGGFSKVYLCRFKQNGKFYAMKVIDKQFIMKNKKKKIVMNEKQIMEKLKHPFLIEMKFAFQSKNCLIFVLDLCPGGELFGLVKKFRVMSEHVAKFYFIQILLGLEEIHKNNVIYRDFKPENILIDMDGHIRIADFGLAKPGIRSIKEKAYSFCGSPEYMPPQMITKKGHSFPVDFYCLGALLYELVTGLPPFYSQNSNEIYQGTLSKPLVFPAHAKISDELKDMLGCLLEKDEFRRLGTCKGVEEVLQHPWLINADLQGYIKKTVDPPVRFTTIKDLKLIFSQMKNSNNEDNNDILLQQKNETNNQYEHVFEKFYYDHRSQSQPLNSLKDKQKSKQNNRNSNNNSNIRIINLSRNRSSLNLKSGEKLLGNMQSNRWIERKFSMRKKPLSNRFISANLLIR